MTGFEVLNPEKVLPAIVEADKQSVNLVKRMFHAMSPAGPFNLKVDDKNAVVEICDDKVIGYRSGDTERLKACFGRV